MTIRPPASVLMPGGWLLLPPAELLHVRALAIEGARAIRAGGRRLPLPLAEAVTLLDHAAAVAVTVPSAEPVSGAAVAGPAPSPMTARQAAGELQVSERMVRRLCQRGTLVASRVGPMWTVDPASVAAYRRRGAVA